MNIGYARVSREDQNLALQEDALREAGCGKVFSEKASGHKNKRPALTEALEFAREGDTLIVWKLDRLGRSLSQLVRTVECLQAEGIGFRCIMNPEMNTTTPNGKLIFGMFAVLAEYERELLIERTMAGLAAAKARGRVGGRPRTVRPTQVPTIQAMHKNGENISSIARQHEMNRATVYRVLEYPEKYL